MAMISDFDLKRAADVRRKEIDDLTWRVVQALYSSCSSGKLDMQQLWQAVRVEIDKGYP